MRASENQREAPAVAPPLHRLARALVAIVVPLGQWRANFLVRCFGFVLLLLEGGRLIHSVVHLRIARPEESTTIAFVGLVMLVAGPRLLALAFSSVASLYFLHGAIVSERGHLRLLADEYLLYFTVPFLITVFACLELGRLMRAGNTFEQARRSGDVDDAMTLSFRMHILIALFFAGFHKFNEDFFNERGSCLTLNRRLTSWWNVPAAFISAMRPWHIAVGELLAPFILLAAPRVGIVVIALMVSGFGHIGPVAFAACCICLALGFLRLSDGAVLKRAYTHVGWWLLPLLAGALYLVSSSMYEGKRDHLPFYVYELFALNALFLVGALVVEDVAVFRRARAWGATVPHALALAFGPAAIAPPSATRAPSLKEAAPPRGAWGRLSSLQLPRLRPREITLWPKARVFAAVFGVVFALHIFNGFTPYFGLKYRLSYAMLANLRVDDWRWNHYFVPKSVRFYPRDALIHVVGVDIPAGHRRLAREKKLKMPRGLTVGWALDERLRQFRKAGVHVSITIDDDGVRTTYPDAPFHPDLRARLRQERVYGRMFQKTLRTRGAQGCVH